MGEFYLKLPIKPAFKICLKSVNKINYFATVFLPSDSLRLKKINYPLLIKMPKIAICNRVQLEILDNNKTQKSNFRPTSGKLR